MINIEYAENVDEKYYGFMDDEFNRYALENGVVCEYKPFSFIAKDGDEFVGIITSNSYYKEVHVREKKILS